jgi:protein-S-isoprenylcysteine O-methyltransferase Ste14
MRKVVDISLLDDWKVIAKTAWSFRFMALAAVLEVCGIFLPLFIDDLPRVWFGVLSLIVIMAGMYARLLFQRNLSCNTENSDDILQ